MDRVGAVSIPASARAPAEHLAHQVELTLVVEAVEARVADRLLIGWNAAVHGLRDRAGQDAEQSQDDERARVGRCGEDGRQQRARRREAQLDQWHHALVDVELRHPLGRVGQISQDGRQPLLEEDAVGVVPRVVDRPLGLRARSREIDHQAIGRPRQGDPLRVQARRVDAVVLRIVLPHVRPLGDAREQLTPERLGGPIEDRVEARLDLGASVAAEEIGQALGAHAARRHLTVEVATQAVGQSRVPGQDADHVLVGPAGMVEAHGRDDDAFLVRADRVRRHRAGYCAADVVVMAERLDEGDDVTRVEHRDRHAEVGQVADAALGAVDVVVEEHVSRPHRLDRKVAHDRLNERGVRPTGELSAAPVVDAGAEVARLADHRRARGALDGRLDLGLHRGQGALHDLDDDGIRVHIFFRVSTRLPKRSTSATSPGKTTVVEPNSSTIAGPASRSPEASRVRS